MTELVALKVKIVIGPDGKHQFPAFGKISGAIRKTLNWSNYIDRYGTGWIYDKRSGFGELDQGGDPSHVHVNDDTTCWYGAFCIPADFAEAAVDLFPDECTILDETEWAAFWDDRSYVDAETEILDGDVLRNLQARVALEGMDGAPTVTPSAEILTLRTEMLDPASQRKGIRKNLKKKWTDAKVLSGITIRPKA